MRTSFKVKIFLFSVMLTVSSFAQQISKPDWSGYNFLIGEWIGEGSGSAGEATGSSTFSFDLQNSVIIRKSFAEYPAASNRPAFRHDDLMIIYQENKTIKAMYFDNENHVINYTVGFSTDSSSIVFVSEPSTKSPRFRFTYTKYEVNRLKFSFEFAPPGKPEEFSKYLDGIVKKKTDK